MRKQKDTYNKPLDIETRMRILANMLIDRVLEMTPEERKALEKKIEEDKHKVKTKID